MKTRKPKSDTPRTTIPSGLEGTPGSPIPLSLDLELRPRGTAPVSVRQALGPLVRQYIGDLVEASEGLKRLAEEAYRANDRTAEAALRAKIVDQATALLRLCREDSQPHGAGHVIRSQSDVPRWASLSPQTRRSLEAAWEAAEKEWGPLKGPVEEDFRD